MAAVAAGDLGKEVVEGGDRPSEQGVRATEQVALHAVDVEAVRDDENGLLVQAVQVAIEEPRDLSAFAGPTSKASGIHPF